MSIDGIETRYVNNVLKRLNSTGVCAVFRVGDKLHYTNSPSNVPELLAIYKAGCPLEYLREDARSYARE